MSYRFNNGRGAVTCDLCQIIFDEKLGYKEYEQVYGKRSSQDVCPKCKGELNEARNKNIGVPRVR